MNTINNTSFGCGHDIDILYTHIIYVKRYCRQALVISPCITCMYYCNNIYGTIYLYIHIRRCT